ncbi:capsule biosynthesis protein [Reyranella sp.]|uniref:capsule biosynthesis protein n=1 Tax=Reyranella sp. TaxID=1929291 RepID=UPI003BA99CB9
MPDASQLETYARLLRLTPVGDVPVEAQPQPADEKATPTKARYRWLAAGRPSFWLLVVLPTCLAAAYFWLVAADRFESEARFILRTPGQSTANAAAAAGLTHAVSGVTRANEDGYIVEDFLESRDAMKFLVDRADLRGAIAAGNGDPLWQFPNFFTSDTEEGLYSHFQRLISIDFDSTTGISTLRMEAFRPADADRLTRALLDAAETLVNRLNDRSRRDAVSTAESEAARMRQRTIDAQAALTAFRERERLIDPSQATMAIVETIARLSVDVADISVQLNELAKNSPRTPQAGPLRNRRAAIEAQIVEERQRLAGDAKSIAPRIVEYERLMLEREFAERALMAALTAVETARVDAQRQRIYLERVAEPSRPDYPAYPLGLLWTAAVLVAGYMTYRIWSILAADARRHADP